MVAAHKVSSQSRPGGALPVENLRGREHRNSSGILHGQTRTSQKKFTSPVNNYPTRKSQLRREVVWKDRPERIKERAILIKQGHTPALTGMHRKRGGKSVTSDCRGRHDRPHDRRRVRHHHHRARHDRRRGHRLPHRRRSRRARRRHPSAPFADAPR